MPFPPDYSKGNPFKAIMPTAAPKQSPIAHPDSYREVRALHCPAPSRPVPIIIGISGIGIGSRGQQNYRQDAVL